MLRSLTAVLIAVLIGLTLAKLVEASASALLELKAPEAEPAPGNAVGEAVRLSISSMYGGVLVASWGLGAFVAASVALLMGRRWAALAWLAGVTVSFNGVIVLLGADGPAWLWPASLMVGPLGAWAANAALGAQSRPRVAERPAGLFE